MIFSLIQFALAVMLVVFGLDSFIGFMPTDQLDGFAGRYMEVMRQSYIFPFIGGVYLVSASLLLINRMVGLAVIMTFPIALNAVLFHITMDPANAQPALVFFALHAIVIYRHRKDFIPLFK